MEIEITVESRQNETIVMGGGYHRTEASTFGSDERFIYITNYLRDPREHFRIPIESIVVGLERALAKNE